MRNFDAVLKDICANPSAEDAGANLLNIWSKFGDIPQLEIDEKGEVQNYIETVCGYEGAYDLEDLSLVFGIFDIHFIPSMLDFIQDIQEYSKDCKCKYRIYCNMHFQPDI